MSSVNAGRVELDIVAIAKDQVSATLREVNKSLAGTKAQMDGVSTAGKTGGFSLTSLASSAKGALAPMDGVRTSFENLRGNLLGFPTAIAGAVAAFVGLVSELEDADRAAADLKENATKYEAALKGIVEWVDKLKTANHKQTAEDSQQRKDRIDQQDKFRDMTQNLLVLESEIATVKERQKAVADSMFGGLADSKQAYLTLKGLENDRLELEKAIADYTRESAENMQRQLTSGQLLAGLRGAAAGTGAGIETIDGTIAVHGRRPRGGGRGPSSDASEMARRLYEHQRNALDELDAMGRGDTDGAMVSGGRRGGMAGGIARQVSALEDNKAAVAALASEYDALGASINSLAGPLGMLSGGLGELTRALGTGLTAAAQFTSGDILGGIGSVLGGIMDLFGGTEKKTRDLVRQADLDRNKGAPSTVVINVAPGTDPQSVARELRRVDYSSRGTGSRNPGV